MEIDRRGEKEKRRRRKKCAQRDKPEVFLENLSDEANSATSKVFMDSVPFGKLLQSYGYEVGVIWMKVESG